MLEHGGRSSVGRAPDCDSGCRGFEPHRPPHIFKKLGSRIYRLAAFSRILRIRNTRSV